MPERYIRKPNTICLVCNKAIYRRPGLIKSSGGKSFCSQDCFGKSCRKEIPCAVCGRLILSGLNKRTCGRECSNKYRVGIKYKIGRPRDKYVKYRALRIRLMEVRGKRCERCGYNKHDILEVHHKDRNRNNNSLSNLELVCPNCHAEDHYLSRME